MNLIINASEAIGEAHGEIRVSLTIATVIDGVSEKDYSGKIIVPGRYVCLEVADNGSGMDEETKRRIFEPFYTTKFTGRGLGMSAVLGIIKSHGGALQLISHQGQGTIFKVFLPVQKHEFTEQESLPFTVSATWRGSGTLLLAEDEEQVRLILKSMLETIGFTVIEASNGTEALELYHRHSGAISLIITDLGMPEMNGYELFRELKKLNSDVPIIVSSGFGDAEVESRIPREQFAGFISKPYNFEQLRELLRGVFEKG
jgi:CheY-like chemotaxis protein